MSKIQCWIFGHDWKREAEHTYYALYKCSRCPEQRIFYR